MNPSKEDSFERRQSEIVPPAYRCTTVEIEAFMRLRLHIDSLNDEKKLHPGQHPSIHATVNCLESVRPFTYVKKPPGTGKSFEGVKLSEGLKSCGIKTIVVSPSLDSCSNWRDEYTRFAPDLKVQVGNHRDVANSDVWVMTYSRAISLHKKGLFSKECLVILDEAHEALGNVRKKVVKEWYNVSMTLSQGWLQIG